jgi:4'-phosphopantetheinyl transferase
VGHYVGVGIDVYRVQLDGPAVSGCANRALMAILASRLGHSPVIARNPHGKPELVGESLAFNVSHSGVLAAIAVSDVGPIGVDLEEHADIDDPAAIARRFFTPAEAATIEDDPAAFYRLWCRKEAWIKAQGVGLDALLERVDVRTPPAGWMLVDLDLAAGYSAAVACRGGPVDIRVIDYASDDSARSGAAIIARSTSR